MVGVDSVVVDGEDLVVAVVGVDLMVDMVDMLVVDGVDVEEDIAVVGGVGVEGDMAVVDGVGVVVVVVAGEGVVDLDAAVVGTIIEVVAAVVILSPKQSPLTNKKRLLKMVETLAI